MTDSNIDELIKNMAGIITSVGLVITACGTIYNAYQTNKNKLAIDLASAKTDDLHKVVDSQFSKQKAETQAREDAIRELSVAKAVREVDAEAAKKAAEEARKTMMTVNALSDKIAHLEIRLAEAHIREAAPTAPGVGAPGVGAPGVGAPGSQEPARVVVVNPPDIPVPVSTDPVKPASDK